MRKRNIRKAHPTNISSREIDPLPWSYFVVIAICGCILAAGFFLAARQHFASMELGMTNSKMRSQLEDLESENRRLTLAREVAFSPAEITKTARSLGFLEINTTTAALPILAPDKTVKANQVRAVEKATAFEAMPASLTMIAYQRPAKVVSTETPSKITSPENQTKKNYGTNPKPIKTEITAIAKLR